MTKKEVLKSIKELRDNGINLSDVEKLWNESIESEFTLDKEDIISRAEAKYLGKIIKVSVLEDYLFVQKVTLVPIEKDGAHIVLHGPRVSFTIEKDRFYISKHSNHFYERGLSGGEARIPFVNNSFLKDFEKEIIDHEVFKSRLSYLSDSIREFTDTLIDYVYYEGSIIK